MLESEIQFMMRRNTTLRSVISHKQVISPKQQRSTVDYWTKDSKNAQETKQEEIKELTKFLQCKIQGAPV
jgi:hypothetical protein